MKHKILIKTFLLIVLPFIAMSQKDSTVTLSLSDAQQYAVTHNLNLENARLDIESAEKKVWETTAIGLPQINGNVSYQYIPGELPTASFGSDSSTAMLYGYIFNSLSTLEALHGANILDAVPVMAEAEPFTLGVKNSTTYSVTVSQLVFSGEWIVGLQAAKTYLKISTLSHEKQEQEIKAGVITSYISILILENNLKILDSTVKNMESLVKETKLLSEKGFLESTDADQLQINLNTLINSRNTIQRQIEVSYMLFKILLGTDLNSNLVLNDNLDAVYNQFVLGNQNQEFNLMNNIDYKMLNNQVEITELSYKREKTKYLPTISAFYNYQDKTNKASFDFTINHIIGVNLDMPIFSSFSRNAVVQQAKIDYQKSLNNQILLENNLKTSEQQLSFNFINALDKYNITTQNVELSKNVFDNITKKFKLGMVSSMDLTQANNTYLQSQSDNTSALFELFKTKIELEKILNEL